MKPHRLLCTLLLAGPVACATIVHGTGQEVGFSSTPAAARVIIDGKPVGTTPVVTRLARKSQHTVRIELEGYRPFEGVVSRGVSGWVFGNIVFGGLIGLAVDATSGGMYKLSPAQLAAQLQRHDPTSGASVDGMYVLVALRPDPAWQPVGRMERE